MVTLLLGKGPSRKGTKEPPIRVLPPGSTSGISLETVLSDVATRTESDTTITSHNPQNWFS